MHELGILVHMAKTLKSLAEENQLTEIGGSPSKSVRSVVSCRNI